MEVTEDLKPDIFLLSVKQLHLRHRQNAVRRKPKAKAALKVAAKKTKKGKGGQATHSQLISLKLTNFLLTKPHIFRCGNGKERGG